MYTHLSIKGCCFQQYPTWTLNSCARFNAQRTAIVHDHLPPLTPVKALNRPLSQRSVVINARKKLEPSKAQIWPLNMSGSIAERKVTKFGQFQPFNSLKKVFINGNNGVQSLSSLRGNDLGWWLVLLTDLAEQHQPPTWSLRRSEDRVLALLFPN